MNATPFRHSSSDLAESLYNLIKQKQAGYIRYWPTILTWVRTHGEQRMRERILLMTVITGLVIALDQWSKSWAIETLQGMPSQSYLGGSMLFLYAENTGAWGSMGSSLSDTARFWLLTVMPSAFLAGLTWYTCTSKELKLYMVGCYALVIGGGIGNLVDRAMYGYVVDFLWTGIPGGLGTNIYNIADVAIMAGIITLLVMHLIYERHEAPTSSGVAKK